MGRRYGRNQKRRHRERIAQLEVQYGATYGALLAVRAAHADLQSLYDGVRKRIEERFSYSALLDALDVEGLTLDAVRIHGLNLMRGPDCLALDLRGMGAPPSVLDVLRPMHGRVIEVPMFLFEVMLDQQADRLSREVHMRLRGGLHGREEWHYVLSLDLLLSMEHKRATIEQMGRTFARRAVELACHPEKRAPR